MKYILSVLLASAFIISVGCKQESTTNTKVEVETKHNIAENDHNKKGTLLFFMNPHGMPCQVQDNIINSISNEITQKLNIRYVKTTNPDDRSSFYDYTIRGLPSMIIVDNNLSEIKRFTPGIIQKNEILNEINRI